MNLLVMLNLKNNSEELKTILTGTHLDNLNRAIPGDWKAKDDTNAIQPIDPKWFKEIIEGLVPLIQTNAKNEEKKS